MKFFILLDENKEHLRRRRRRRRRRRQRKLVDGQDKLRMIYLTSFLNRGLLMSARATLRQ